MSLRRMYRQHSSRRVNPKNRHLTGKNHLRRRVMSQSLRLSGSLPLPRNPRLPHSCRLLNKLRHPLHRHRSRSHRPSIKDLSRALHPPVPLKVLLPLYSHLKKLHLPGKDPLIVLHLPYNHLRGMSLLQWPRILRLSFRYLPRNLRLLRRFPLLRRRQQMFLPSTRRWSRSLLQKVEHQQSPLPPLSSLRSPNPPPPSKVSHLPHLSRQKLR